MYTQKPILGCFLYHKDWKHSKNVLKLVNEGRNWFIYTREYHSAIKRNKVLTYATCESISKEVKKKKNVKSYINMGFPGSSAWKNPPANVGDMGLIPGLRDLTCCGATKPVCCNYWVCALGPGICNYWACAWQLLKPMCLESMLHNKRIHSIEKPEHCKWRAAPTCCN